MLKFFIDVANNEDYILIHRNENRTRNYWGINRGKIIMQNDWSFDKVYDDIFIF